MKFPVHGFEIVDADDTPAQASLRCWESLTRRGLDAHRSGQPALALPLYRRALRIAQALLAGPFCEACDARSVDDRLAAFVVSHLNLADLYADGDDPGLGLAHVNHAHQVLITLMCDEHAPRALRDAACRHSRETHVALLGRAQGDGRPLVGAVSHEAPMPLARHGATVH